MNLTERLEKDYKSAMLGKDTLSVSVLRMVKSEIKNSQINAGSDINENQIQLVIRKEIKKRQESAKLYLQGGNTQQADQETKEAKILGQYLPEPISQEAIQEVVEQFISGLENPSAKAKGTVIKQVMNHFQGQADGSTIAATVNRLIPN